nr:hypothetical protein [Tanacetum cinerariifolium]
MDSQKIRSSTKASPGRSPNEAAMRWGEGLAGNLEEMYSSFKCAQGKAVAIILTSPSSTTSPLPDPPSSSSHHTLVITTSAAPFPPSSQIHHYHYPVTPIVAQPPCHHHSKGALGIIKT